MKHLSELFSPQLQADKTRLQGMEAKIQFLIHIGGKLIEKPDGRAGYEGGRTKLTYLTKTIVFGDIVKEVSDKVNVNMISHSLKFILKDDPCTLIELEDNLDIGNMFQSNDNKIYIYVVPREKELVLEPPPPPPIR